MDNKTPYKILKLDNVKDFYCQTCNQWHYNQTMYTWILNTENPNYLTTNRYYRTCSYNEIKNFIADKNNRHNRILQLSNNKIKI